jgi:putative tryptophan/tyrosine transport system substrate-binding protein
MAGCCACAVRGQASAVPPGEAASAVGAFRVGLGDLGYIEGKNVTIEYRWADGQYDRLSALAADLVHLRVSVILAAGGSGLTAKAATTTIPIVFTHGGDPVQEGLVASLNRPGGNATGVVFFSSVLGAKRLELLRQLVPKATTFGVLVIPNIPETQAERRDLKAAAQTIEQQVIILDVRSDRDIETAFATFVQRGVGALLGGAGPFLLSHRERIVALAARHAMPCRSLTPNRKWSAQRSSEDDCLINYSITSSAATRRFCGTVRPRVLAVLRLMTSSNLVDCTIGRSAGFSPLRIRPV